MQVVFITGAEGFAGTHLFQFLRQRGFDVVAGVRNRARKLAFEKQYGKALVCDVSDAINVARSIASIRPNYVVHLAGTSRPADAADEPLIAYQNIVTAWANVLDAVRRTVPRAKVLMVSGSDVYGTAGNSGQPVNEATAIEPVTTYGALKAAAESIAETFHRNYHVDVTIARPFVYTGAGQSENFFFGAIARRIVDWDSVVHGDTLRLPDLDARRDVLHIDDVVSAYHKLLTDGKPNEIYNVCSGKAVPCRELIDGMLQQCKKQVRFESLPPGDEDVPITALCGDHSKLTRELGWSPTRSAADALNDLLTSCRGRTTAAAA